LGDELTMAGCYSYQYVILNLVILKQSVYVATHFPSYTESKVLFHSVNTVLLANSHFYGG